MDGMYAENAGAFFCRNDGDFGPGYAVAENWRKRVGIEPTRDV